MFTSILHGLEAGWHEIPSTLYRFKTDENDNIIEVFYDGSTFKTEQAMIENEFHTLIYLAVDDLIQCPNLEEWRDDLKGLATFDNHKKEDINIISYEPHEVQDNIITISVKFSLSKTAFDNQIELYLEEIIDTISK